MVPLGAGYSWQSLSYRLGATEVAGVSEVPAMGRQGAAASDAPCQLSKIIPAVTVFTTILPTSAGVCRHVSSFHFLARDPPILS